MQISVPDSERFGIHVARTRLETLGDLDETHALARARGLDMLIVRVATRQRAVAAALRRVAGEPLDEILYFEGAIPTEPVSPAARRERSRCATASDAGDMAAIARHAFAGYCGHYHADPRLPRHCCDEVYASWAARCCSERGVADSVQLLTDETDDLLGFCALKLLDAATCEFGLNAIAPEHQHRGLYRQLLGMCFEWARQQGASRWASSTQLANTRVVGAWRRRGWRESSRDWTYHWWLT